METHQKHWISKFKLKIKLEIKNHQTMLPVCLPALSFNALVPLALAWAWFSVQLLPDLLVDREQ